MRLRARLPVLWLGSTRVQIGTDARWAVALHDLSPSAVRGLLDVAPGADERGIRAALNRHAVPTVEADAVLAHLRAAHLLVDSPTPARDPTAPLHRDAAAWALMEPTGDPSPMVRARASARIRVSGLGRLGAGVAMILGAAGIRHLELDDDRPVGPDDIGWAGVTVRDVGSPRPVAVARALRDAAPGVDVRGGRPDLVVLCEQWVADPVRHRPLLADDVAHVSLVMREASALIGPLVEPGRSPCLRCADLRRTEHNPDWPTVAAQLAVTAPCPEETALVAVAGALGAAGILAHVDGRPSTLDGAVIEVRLPDLVPRTWRIAPHPDCGCCGLA